MYVLILGLDVLGNPFGFIRDLSEGVEAFFYEPYQVKISVGLLWNVAKMIRYELYCKFGYINNLFHFKSIFRIENSKWKWQEKLLEWHKISLNSWLSSPYKSYARISLLEWFCLKIIRLPWMN